MILDVIDLCEFYDTPLGRHCQRRISHMIQTVWPDLSQLSVLGLGFAIPYLNKEYIAKAERVSIMMDSGHILIITPNRRSIWAQLDDSPFGHGNPYTLSQLNRFLRELQFTPIQSIRDLYIFPSHYRLVQSLFPLFDTIGPLVFTKFSGIVAIEAIKQVYGSILFKEKKAFNAAMIRTKISQIPG